MNMQWVSCCPFFPQYQLADDATLVKSLGTGIEWVEVYEERLARRIPAPLTHTFTLTSECHIFVRHYGVTRSEGFLTYTWHRESWFGLHTFIST